MKVKIENELGTTFIDHDVISTIAGASAVECYGLVGMASKSPTDGIVKLLKREHLNKGVKIHVVENEIIIDLFVVVQFGTKISVVANNIIEKVKYNVSNLTGIAVKKVNINVEGVRVQG